MKNDTVKIYLEDDEIVVRSLLGSSVKDERKDALVQRLKESSCMGKVTVIRKGCPSMPEFNMTLESLNDDEEWDGEIVVWEADDVDKERRFKVLSRS